VSIRENSADFLIRGVFTTRDLPADYWQPSTQPTVPCLGFVAVSEVRDPGSAGRGCSVPWGKTSYFHWMSAIRSSSLSNSSGEREVQKRATRRAISRRTAAIAS